MKLLYPEINKSYDRYLLHQASKLTKHPEWVKDIDTKYEKAVFERYKGKQLSGEAVLCLGARLGGEVRAFKRIGALAIGVDINPGEKNKDVVYGDFHKTNFPDGVFDAVFCNSIDHVYHFDEFFSEVYRLLKEGGRFFCEIAIQKGGEYETIDTLDITWIKEKISYKFNVVSISKVEFGWKGELVISQKM